MAKRKDREEGLYYEHIITGIKISISKVCDKCPYKIYSTPEETVAFGIGNIYSNFIFILPTYNHRAKINGETSLTLLNKTYNEITGKNMFEEVYTTRLVKCSKNTDHSLYQSSIGPCSNFLIYEINKLDGKHVVFFGSAYDDYINNSSMVGMNIPHKIIHKIYSPDILHYDNSKIKETFINNLTKILSYD